MFFTDLDGHMLQKQDKLTLIGSLKDIDVKDCTHGALYPNVSVFINRGYQRKLSYQML